MKMMAISCANHYKNDLINPDWIACGRFDIKNMFRVYSSFGGKLKMVLW
jgi:hypothetical protein